MVLTVRDTAPALLQSRQKEMAALLQDRTGLIVEVHQVVAAQRDDGNGSCCQEDPGSSDIWFSAVDPRTQVLCCAVLCCTDPVTQALLQYNDSVAMRHITGRRAQTSLKYTITGDLHLQVSSVCNVSRSNEISLHSKIE